MPLPKKVPTDFTAHYSQPEAYRFCLDSVLFSKLIASRECKLVTENSCVLDLCAGCGVVGLEFRHYVPQLAQLDFLEIQDEFQEHLDVNVGSARVPRSRRLQMNYANLRTPEFRDRYDLILCNPPYFFKDDGRLSPSIINNRCRFFIDSDFDVLIEAAWHTLKPRGRAYLLVKDGRTHGRNSLRTVQLHLGARADVEAIDRVRTTTVLKITKLP